MRSGRAGDMCMQNLHISAHTHTHIYMPYKSHRSSMELCVSIPRFPRQTSMRGGFEFNSNGDGTDDRVDATDYGRIE